MKIKLPVWDVGFELEIFLTNDTGTQIYNASKLLERDLGFSIDQNKTDAGHLRLNDGYVLRTDGTPIELQWFRLYNRGTLPTDWASVLHSIQVLKPYQRSFTPYFKAGDVEDLGAGRNERVTFVEAGQAFASSKALYNAYTGEFTYPDKKKEGLLTTERTAGLHLHFSLSQFGFSGSDSHAKNIEDQRKLNDLLFPPGMDPEGRRHTNALIQILDDIYKEMFGPNSGNYFSKASQQRLDRWQKLGNYRIKSDTETGLSTLEYRELDASMMGDHARLQKFVDIFQYQALLYLRAAGLA
jgi:hypothetical protein